MKLIERRRAADLAFAQTRTRERVWHALALKPIE